MPHQKKVKGKNNNWVIVKDWTCTIHTDVGVIRFKIKKDYWYDLASVPKILRSIIDNGSGDGRVLIAALIHDALYDTHLFTRNLSDIIFYQLLLAQGVFKPLAYTYYKAVDICGEKPYNTFDPEQMKIDKTLISVTWDSK